MLVYGDHACERDSGDMLGAIEARLTGGHDAIVTAFILTSELAQAIADAELAERGVDSRSSTTDLTMRLLVALARAIDESWAGRRPSLEAVRRLLGDLLLVSIPATLRTKRAEGHAYYALYPEAYLEAARRVPLAPDHVIGIRSIGCGLAALVAAGAGTGLPATVRPRGHPFRRELHVSRDLLLEWTCDRDATIAIADEGPGLSGSSFGAVADLLESRGVDQLFYFPSHAGELGPAANPRHRERWQRARRYVVTAPELLRGRLEAWLEALLGPLDQPLVDVSAGGWRRLCYAHEEDWPPAFVQQERLKYLARTNRGVWLARFVGLGEHGERAYELARATSAAGFTPPVAGLTHGFLVERWLDDARCLDVRAIDRNQLIGRVGDYLEMRATRPGAPGANCTELIEMVMRNASLSVGPEVASQIVSRMAPIEMRSVQVDARLHAWEWLVQSDNSLIKTDAYDHHDAHDLIGCQDIAWDVVGAATELELSADEEVRLAARLDVDPRRIAFLRPCYLAFQLGRMTLAAQAEPREAERAGRAASRYRELLISRC